MKLSKPVLVNGVYYNSINIAAHKIGVDNNTITQRIKSKNFPEYSFTEYKPPLEKICFTCKSIKLLDQFKKFNKSRDGRSSWCKKCWSIYVIIHQNKENKKRNNSKWGRTEKGKLSRKCNKEIRRSNELRGRPNLSLDEKII